MKVIKLRCTITDTVLYEGRFENVARCLEQAMKDRADITNVSLKNMDLSCAALDEASFHMADFTGANLTGANLSEANFTDCRFLGAALFNTCLSYSRLLRCGFEGASFGGTEITGTWLEDCRFSTLSCFTLDFVQAATMRGTSFIGTSGEAYPMTRPPLVIRGAQMGPVSLLDRHIKIGARVMPIHACAEHLQLVKGIEKLQKMKMIAA